MAGCWGDYDDCSGYGCQIVRGIVARPTHGRVCQVLQEASDSPSGGPVVVEHGYPFRPPGPQEATRYPKGDEGAAWHSTPTETVPAHEGSRSPYDWMDWMEAHDPEPQPALTEVQEAIIQECDNISNMLLAKNRQYGDSAMNPLRIFSRADAAEQLRVRIDDKLSRILRGIGDEEDTVGDLIGYLVLYRCRRRLGGV